MPERCQPATRPQHLCRLDRSRNRVYPVPGCPGDDRVEFAAGAVPGFERRHLDLNPAAPGEVSHPGVRLDAEHVAPGRLELPGFYAGAAADVEHVGPGAGGDDPLHQGVRVPGPGPVVAFGVRAERFRYLPVLMRLTPGKTRSPRR